MEFDRGDGCAEFFFSLKNVNPGGSPPMPDPINEFYLNVEAGVPDSGSNSCRSDILSGIDPPLGFTASVCKPFDANGHGVVKFTGGDIPPNLTGEGRVKIDTNGLTAFTNPETGITVPALAVVLSIAQNHPDDEFDADAACASGNVGPTADDGALWSVPLTPVAFQAVPALSTAAKVAMMLCVIAAAAALMRRGRRSTSA